MEIKEFLSDFLSYNKKILKKMIIIIILVFYFAFLSFYNIFKIHIGYSIEVSWMYGVISSIIFTLISVLSIDIAFFYKKKKKSIKKNE